MRRQRFLLPTILAPIQWERGGITSATAKNSFASESVLIQLVSV
jgi:hypothetical protein